MAAGETLGTGWEPGVPAGDTLLRSFVFAFADRLSWMASRTGGTVERSDAARIVDLGSRQLFDNAVVLLQPPGGDDLAAVVERAFGRFGRARPWVLLSLWPLPDLRPSGLALMGHPPVMVRMPGAPPPPGPPGLALVEVDDERRVADFAATLVAGFPVADAGALGDARVLGGPLRLWVGYAEDRPVAVAAAFVTDEVVDVESVATLPDVRGRGFGAALTWRATLAADRPAMLLSSDAGRTVYQRMGYVPVLRATLWFSAGQA